MDTNGLILRLMNFFFLCGAVQAIALGRLCAVWNEGQLPILFIVFISIAVWPPICFWVATFAARLQAKWAAARGTLGRIGTYTWICFATTTAVVAAWGALIFSFKASPGDDLYIPVAMLVTGKSVEMLDFIIGAILPSEN